MKKIILCMWIIGISSVGAQTGYVGIGTQSPTATLNVKSTPTDTMVLNITNSDSEHLLTVLSNGRVGVGVKTPSTSLDVNGAVRIAKSNFGTTGGLASHIRFAYSSNRVKYFALYNTNSTGQAFSNFPNSFIIYDRTYPKLVISPEQTSAVGDPIPTTPAYIYFFTNSGATPPIKNLILIGKRTPFSAPKSNLEIAGSFATAINKVGSVTLDKSHSTVIATGGDITLPPVKFGLSKAAGTYGRIYTIYLDSNAPANTNVTVSVTGSDKIRDIGIEKTSVTITNDPTKPGNKGIRLQSYGDYWYVTGRFF